VESGSTEADLKRAIEPYLSVVDFLMFDTKSEDKWGGTGQTFDWSLIKNIASGKPIFLSGGLNKNNVREACRQVAPYAVDLSSSLESEAGRKDFDKVEAFMEEMRLIWDEQEMGSL
jgi:phosphoribosylanthranilate isomerase